MQFIRLNNYLVAVHITGPKHNLLQICLSQSAGEIVCECLPASGKNGQGQLDQTLVIQAVLDGLHQANQELDSSFAVSAIRYVENDTGPESIYAFLTLNLLKHLHGGGQFVEQADNP